MAFAGQGRDRASGLYHLRARQYDPATGRFTSPDPTGYAVGGNLYAYAGNNPATWVDRAGTTPTDPLSGRRREGGGPPSGVVPISGRPTPGPTGEGKHDKTSGVGVYVLQDDAGHVRYVGKGDVPARLAKHRLDRDKRQLRPRIVANNNLTEIEATGLEHLLIKHYGGPGGRLLNLKNGFKASHPLRDEFLRAGQSLLDEALAIIGP